MTRGPFEAFSQAHEKIGASRKQPGVRARARAAGQSSSSSDSGRRYRGLTPYNAGVRPIKRAFARSHIGRASSLAAGSWMRSYICVDLERDLGVRIFARLSRTRASGRCWSRESSGCRRPARDSRRASRPIRARESALRRRRRGRSCAPFARSHSPTILALRFEWASSYARSFNLMGMASGPPNARSMSCVSVASRTASDASARADRASRAISAGACCCRDSSRSPRAARAG